MWCLRRLNLMMRTLSPRPWASTSAVTFPPSTFGAPMRTSSPSPTIRTWSISTLAPCSASSFSTRRTSPSVARYCLPPVENTAYMDESPQKLASKEREFYRSTRCESMPASDGARRHVALLQIRRTARVGLAVVAYALRVNLLQIADLGWRELPITVGAVAQRLADGLELALEHRTGDRSPGLDSRGSVGREGLRAGAFGPAIKLAGPDIVAGGDHLAVVAEAGVDGVFGAIVGDGGARIGANVGHP